MSCWTYALLCCTRIVCLSFFFLILAYYPVHGGENGKRDIDLIYIDANTAGSSGGHAALRLGKEVYHYQHYTSGFFLPVRDKWKHFKTVYNDLENRTLYINRISIPESDFNNIEHFFREKHLAMELHMANLSALKEEYSFLEACSLGKTNFSFKGAGLFGAASVTKPFFTLKEKDWIQKAIKEAEKRIREFQTDISTTNTEPSPRTFPHPVVTSTSKYLELTHYLNALNFILEGRKVKDSALLYISIHLRECLSDLNENEISALKLYRERLKTEILDMISSVRPDTGWPIMLAFARLQAVTLSMESRSIIILDPFSDRADFIESAAQSKDKAIQTIFEGQSQDFTKVRKLVFAQPYLDEASYNLIENSAARLYETARYMNQRDGNIRVQSGIMIPEKNGYLPFKVPYFNNTEPKILTEMSGRRYEAYRNSLREIYRYGIANHNCVTELIDGLYTAIGDRERAEKILGGYIYPYSGLFFIPFVFDAEILNGMSVNRRITMPSYRKRVANRVCAEKDLFSCIKEASPITSNVYKNLGEEQGFLLFTDDAISTRPILGALNIVYGAIYSGGGIFTLPFDRGKMLREGLKGTFFSLPELFFFNIRKGDFSAVR